MSYVTLVNPEDIFIPGMIIIGVAIVYLICMILNRKFKEWKKHK